MSETVTENQKQAQVADSSVFCFSDGNIPYGHLLRHTSLFGGVMGVNMLINLFRMKLMAVLIGASGVGIFGMYMGILYAVQGFITLSLHTSGVRDIAEVFGKGDPRRVAHVYRVMRRVLMIMGIGGGIFLFLTAPQSSREIFGNDSQVTAIRLLAVTFFFYNFFIGQEALLQGVRHPVDAARASVIGNLLSACCTVFLLWRWGASGVIPSLLLHSFLHVLVGRFFTCRLHLPMHDKLSWKRTFFLGRSMVYLGLAITLTGSIYNFSSLWIRSYLLKDAGESVVGLYTAASTVSMYAIIFVASSLSMEFFPLLSSLKGQNEAFSRLVNRQVEVLVLIVAPFFLAAMVFSDWLFPLIYSSEFTPGVGAFRWFLVGAMAQLISWPMGLIRYAHKWVVLTVIWEVVSCSLNIGLILLLYPRYGLEGVGMAFALLRLYEYVQNLAVGRYLLGYKVSRGALGISLWTMGSFLGCYVLLHWVGVLPALGLFLISLAGMFRGAWSRFKGGNDSLFA